MDLKSNYCILWLLIFSYFQCASTLFLTSWKTTQLCINSDQPTIKSMCVMCNARQFANTAKECTGAEKIPDVTTQDQAFCLISSCLQQVPKQGISKFFGRKRRSVFI
ncbi:uncharacterized protein LOC141855675 [Brevipalpus obovatus]|uniref:uncharacterized protein LOC141855675 n=1 Tax=Brevipalpus obovatus TaxID=246614 RepID=UPI003D9E80E9